MSKRAPQTHAPLWQEAPVRHYMHTLRKQLGMSQADILRESGYAASTINAIERGYLAPDFIQLAEIAQCLGMRLALVPIVEGQMNGAENRRRRDAVREQKQIPWVEHPEEAPALLAKMGGQ